MKKKRISSKMQINCIFNHKRNKEIIPKRGIFFFSEIYFQFITFVEEENKISREINLLPNVFSAYTFFLPPRGENENLVIMRNVRSFLLNYLLFIFFIFADGWNGHMKELQVDGDQLQINVEELQPVTEYSFRLLAENAVGRSLPSIPLTLVTESEGMT